MRSNSDCAIGASGGDFTAFYLKKRKTVGRFQMNKSDATSTIKTEAHTVRSESAGSKLRIPLAAQHFARMFDRAGLHKERVSREIFFLIHHPKKYDAATKSELLTWLDGAIVNHLMRNHGRSEAAARATADAWFQEMDEEKRAEDRAKLDADIKASMPRPPKRPTPSRPTYRAKGTSAKDANRKQPATNQPPVKGLKHEEVIRAFEDEEGEGVLIAANAVLVRLAAQGSSERDRILTEVRARVQKEFARRATEGSTNDMSVIESAMVRGDKWVDERIAPRPTSPKHNNGSRQAPDAPTADVPA